MSIIGYLKFEINYIGLYILHLYNTMSIFTFDDMKTLTIAIHIIVNGKSVNIYRFEMIALSRKPSRSNFTSPYSIRVYNFNCPILRESHTLIFI